MHIAVSQVCGARQDRITQARQLLLSDEQPHAGGLLESWIEQSWQRCLAQGLRPRQRVGFDPVSAAALRRTAEANQLLARAAQPVLENLERALASSRYFAILTNADGTVVTTHGLIDRQDPRANAIARVGIDLSEANVGTTAIGAALRELRPVWLHRGEHFFQDTAVYSCAGAPVFGPDGDCAGMLDFTGVEVNERAELRHLAACSARAIENALVLQRTHRLLLRLNWPGMPLGEDSDGLVALNADGEVIAANQAARQLLPALNATAQAHCRDLLALPFEMLFDAARRRDAALDVPLWNGLRVQVRATPNGQPVPCVPGWSVPATASAGTDARPLRDIETDLIRRAVDAARGNVAEAARALGISRATVYRKLARPARGKHSKDRAQ